MDTQPDQSSEVIERFKRVKIGQSALRKIRETLDGFEEDRRVDKKFALIGLIIASILLPISFYYFFYN